MMLSTYWRSITISALVAALALPGAAAYGAFDLEQLWRTGQFETALELISARHQAGEDQLEFLLTASEAAWECRDYRLASELYHSYARQVVAQPSAFREAKWRAWQCDWQVGQENPQAAWIENEQQAIQVMLDKHPVARTAGRQLALELDYLLSSVIEPETEIPAELRTDYPASLVVMRAAKEQADEIGLEADTSQRFSLIATFLDEYPQNYWRHIAYRYWLYTTWMNRDELELLKAAQAYLAEYPASPESHGAVSRYLYEAGIEPELGLSSAQRSLELYETALGTSGDAAGIQRLHEATRHIPTVPDFQPPHQRQVFRDYLGSRFNLARYELRREDASAALALLEPVIATNPFTTEEDLTLAPFYFTAGEAYVAKSEPLPACRALIGALVVGDARNRYTLQAAQLLAEVELQVPADELQAIQAEYWPSELADLPHPSFSDITEHSGLSGFNYRRVTWGDVDQDADPDLLLSGSVLLRNDGADGFRDVTRVWGLEPDARGGLFADYDNDGDLDCYTIGVGANGDRLYRNEQMNFALVTPVVGNPTDDLNSEGVAWLDYDRDGWLDLYVANYDQSTEDAPGEHGLGTPDMLYRNLRGVFELADAAAMGLVPPFGEHLAGRGVSPADYDGDGDPDIFVGNYRLGENFLWDNLSAATGEGLMLPLFSNEARMLNVAGRSVDGWWGHTIGSAWGDVDNDGDLDLFSANLAHPRYEYFSDKSMLLLNQQSDGTFFRDHRARAGIKYAETHADPVFFDCNNDGYLDLFITCVYENRGSYLYLNDGRGNFHDVSYLAGARLFNSWGCAVADLDSDGDQDLAVGSSQGVRLLRNDTPPQNWLEVECRGAMPALGAAPASGQLSNRNGIGTRIKLTTADGLQLREIQSGRGTTSGDELVAHFGLGATSAPVMLLVRFPSGLTANLEVEQLDQRIIVNEADYLPTGELEPLEPADEASDEPAAEEAAAAREGPPEDAFGDLLRPGGSRR